jgi:hypothetical protein
MGWIGRYKRHGIVLALLAMAMQMVVAFGHVHLRGLAQHATATVAQRTVAHVNSQTPLQVPGDHDDYCAVCASIFLAATAFTPAPPLLPLPAAFARVEHHFNLASPVIEPLRLAFRSRAPPALDLRSS